AVMNCVSIILIAMVLSVGFLVELFATSPTPTLRLAIQTLVASISGIVSVGIATIYVMMTLGYAQSCRSSGIGFGMMTGRVGAILASFAGGFLIDLGNGSLLPFFVAMLVGSALVSCDANVVHIHVRPIGRRQEHVAKRHSEIRTVQVRSGTGHRSCAFPRICQ